MKTFEQEYNEARSQGDWSGIPEREAANFIAWGIKDPDKIRQYIDLGIDYEEAFEIEEYP